MDKKVWRRRWSKSRRLEEEEEEYDDDDDEILVIFEGQHTDTNTWYVLLFLVSLYLRLALVS